MTDLSKFVANATMIPNAFIDDVMAKVSLPATAIYFVIVRKTRGWHKESDAISLSQFSRLTGIKDLRTIKKALAELQLIGLINRKEIDGKPAFFSLKDIIPPTSDVPPPPTKTPPPFDVPPTSDVPPPPTFDEGGPPTFDVPHKRKERKERNISEVSEVFNFWKVTFNHSRAKFDASRKSIITKALNQYSVEELKLAIIGCSKTDWNMGKNPDKKIYDGLNLILRNSDKIEGFISNSGSSIENYDLMSDPKNAERIKNGEHYVEGYGWCL